MTPMQLGPWRVFPDQNRLFRGDQQVDLQPRCMSLLMCLARHSRRVVSRDELMEKVWDGRIVGEDAINNCVRKLRLALDDDPRRPRLVETIQRRGYRLLVAARPVRPRRRLGALAVTAAAVAGAAFLLLTNPITIYQFRETDTPEQRQAKIERMAGDIERRGDNAHSISIRLPGDSH